VDVSLLRVLLQKAEDLLATPVDGWCEGYARSLKRAVMALAQLRKDRRLNAHLPGKHELLSEAADLGTEIEMTLADAIDAFVVGMETQGLDSLDSTVSALSLVASASDILKQDIRAEAEAMRLDASDDDYTDDELRAFAAQTSVREKHRQKKQLTVAQKAIAASAALRAQQRKAEAAAKKARRLPNGRQPRQSHAVYDEQGKLVEGRDLGRKPR
jgi:hypothetical protein